MEKEIKELSFDASLTKITIEQSLSLGDTYFHEDDEKELLSIRPAILNRCCLVAGYLVT